LEFASNNRTTSILNISPRVLEIAKRSSKLTEMGAPRFSSRLSGKRILLQKNEEKEKRRAEKKKKEVEKRKRKPIEVSTVLVCCFTKPVPTVQFSIECSANICVHSFQINVQILSGRLISLSVSLDDTLEEVSKQIQMKEGINPDHQMLFFNGIKLHFEDTLDECGIRNYYTIFLALRNRGG
jgi:hypothetical protein